MSVSTQNQFNQLDPSNHANGVPAPIPPAPQEELSCCGRAWKWLVDYIFVPFYEFLKTLFCCCCKKSNTPPVLPRQIEQNTAQNTPGRIPGTPTRTPVPQRPLPVVALSLPSQISPPLPNIPASSWPSEILPELSGLKHFLEYLATSDEARALLKSAEPVQNNEPSVSTTTPAIVPTRRAPSVPSPANKFQAHLSAVVEKLRHPTEEPLTKKHLSDLQELLIRLIPANSIDLRSPLQILIKIAQKYNAIELLNQINPSTHPLMTSALSSPVLPEAGSVAPITIINPNLLPELSFFRESWKEHNVKQTLLLIANNPKFDQWASFEFPEVVPSYNNTDTPISMRVKALEAEMKNFTFYLFQTQFIAVINRMRLPSNEAPLRAEDIKTLLQLLSKLSRQMVYKVSELLKSFCLIYSKSTLEFFDLYRSYYASNALYCANENLTIYEGEFAPAIDITEVVIPNLEPQNVEKQRALNKVLIEMAHNSAWNSPLSSVPLSSPIRQRDLQESDEDYFAHVTDILSERLTKEFFQQQLRFVVHHLRKGDAPSTLSAKHVNCLVRLLEDIECFDLNPIRMFSKIYRYLNCPNEDTFWSSVTPLIWEEVKGNYLQTESLPSVDDSVLSRPIPNIGNTCYLNSFLQMLTRLSAFNSLLTEPIEFEPTQKRQNETNISYQQRCERELEDFNNELEKKQALQSHLRGVISILRTPIEDITNNPVPPKHLDTLYKLLQINGWKRGLGSEQDPQELVGFLAHQFGSPSTLKITFEITTADGSICSTRQEPLGEIQLSLPYETKIEVNELRGSVSEHHILNEEFQTFDDLYKLYSTESITYTPSNKSQPESCYKSIYIGEAPKVLFVQYKRFDFHPESGDSIRINCDIPFSPTINIPIYSDEEMEKAPKDREPTLQKYKLRAVIGHSGVSAGSGHYRTWALQMYKAPKEDIARDTWIQYDDSLVQRYRRNENDPHALNLQEDIRKYAYYVAYVRVDDEEGAPI